MFGLMRSRSCRLEPEERRRRRLHYCGTCKTLGSRYGQASRLLLDHDAVFAAELLTALAAEHGLDQWGAAYHARNCMRLPVRGEAPPALGYASAMTVVLAEGKLRDRIEDEGRARWRVLRLLFSRGFRRAAADLAGYGFPLDELWRAVRSQKALEARIAAAPARDPDADLAAAAAPTARATALAFSHGARVVGRPEAAEALAAIGRAFGELVYLLDALEDYDRDGRTGEFNAIRVAFGLGAGRLPVETRRTVERRLHGFAAEVEAGLARLPIPSERAALFAERLLANLSRATRVRRLPVAPADCAPAPHALLVAGPGLGAMAVPPSGFDAMGPNAKRRKQQAGEGGEGGEGCCDCCDCCDCCTCDASGCSSCGSCDCSCCSGCDSCDCCNCSCD